MLLASETNRLHKVLDEGGIKLGAVVSDIKGVSARAMVAGLVEGKPISELLSMTLGSLKNKHEELGLSLDGDLSPRHLFILTAHLVQVRRVGEARNFLAVLGIIKIGLTVCQLL